MQQQPTLLMHRAGAARAAPFNPAARRGQRAPEAEAAALAKRQFMRATPYLVGLPRQPGTGELPESVCHLRPSSTAGKRKVEAGPAAGEGAAPAAGEEQQQPREQHGELLHQKSMQQQHEEEQRQPEQQPPQGRKQQRPWFPGMLLTGDADGGQPGSPPAGQQRVGWRIARGLRSEVQRFEEMVATQGQRVTIGKSAIHGWGGFAKTAHRAREYARGMCVCV